MPSKNRYYAIDDILAEEELVPCSTLFEFSFLGHLDPENNVGSNGNGENHNNQHLAENSRVKLPLWAVDKWAMLGFVRVGLPRHFQRKARERLEADPSEVDLRKRNERFFLSGRILVDLVEQSTRKVAKAIANQAGGRGRRNNSAQILKLQAVQKEAEELRKALLSAYTGDRLRNTLDWSLSSVNEDVSAYTNKLSEMERRLFGCGAASSSNHFRWKLNGNRRLTLAKAPKISSSKVATATGGGGSTSAADDDNEGESNYQRRDSKRPRTG